MIFVLHCDVRLYGSDTDAPRQERWTWDFRQGSEKNPGDVAIASSPHSYDSEREARSAIATARKAFGGARMAKVIPSDD